MISHWFFQSPLVNVRTVAIHSYVESIFSLLHTEFYTALSYIDCVPGLIVSSGFNFKGSIRCLAEEFINNSYMSAFFTMELATLTVTLIQ